MRAVECKNDWIKIGAYSNDLVRVGYSDLVRVGCSDLVRVGVHIISDNSVKRWMLTK